MTSARIDRPAVGATIIGLDFSESSIREERAR